MVSPMLISNHIGVGANPRHDDISTYFVGESRISVAVNKVPYIAYSAILSQSAFCRGKSGGGTYGYIVKIPPGYEMCKFNTMFTVICSDTLIMLMLGVLPPHHAKPNPMMIRCVEVCFVKSSSYNWL